MKAKGAPSARNKKIGAVIGQSGTMIARMTKNSDSPNPAMIFPRHPICFS
ncbi:hypothetical protein DSM3645_29916 [Blastopirellula marina DSM 3645]|uniref:Uncharacterized protein n=1 Tax=Blastopirellula marina DSM 3645 TaxID=314230 RepID=A3ZXK8_9BACT|nr:hypothetical protein DSM3645_29916 [Blastopirellula marina DSM 3645]